MGNFPGLTMIPGVGHEHRQDVVCTSYGVHLTVEVFQNCEALPGRYGRTVFVGGRALSSNGFCEVDLGVALSDVSIALGDEAGELGQLLALIGELGHQLMSQLAQL
jgi:hypothetical protein